MSTKDEKAIIILYANLMDEVKARVTCIDYALQGQTGFPNPIVREFCYLQLRMLSELIALSCLVAHGDIAAKYSKRLGKEWSADKIIDQLSKLHTDFYPQPVREAGRKIDPVTGKGHNHLEGINPSPLPKNELLELYGKTHVHLHRGNLKKLLSSDRPINMEINLPEIVKWIQKINDLLSFHIVVVAPYKKIIFCMLRDANNQNKVQAGFMESELA